jgi:pyrroline-5-carboxylate reductase
MAGMDTKRIAVLGAGTMGKALITGLLRAGEVQADALVGTTRHADRAAQVSELLQIPVHTDNCEAARGADVVLLCTKPRVALAVVEELSGGGALDHDPILISIAAGVSTGDLERAAERDLRVVRAMPNTPCLVGAGMTVLARGQDAGDEELDTAERIFRGVGRVVRLDEEHMNAATGLSASGPAFLYVVIEALSEGGLMMGLPRKVATELAAQAAQGAARMVLETGRHPAELKDEVTTPAGCTIAALLSLEDGKLRSVLARGVQNAANAAAELG